MNQSNAIRHTHRQFAPGLLALHALLAIVLTTSCAAPAGSTAGAAAQDIRVGDPLPSWNDGGAKSALIAFANRASTPGPGFIPPEERIAVFDNDGTLWVEKPLPTEVYFVLARVREMADKDPSLKQRQPFKAALEGDAEYFHQAGPKAVLELLVEAETGSIQEEYMAEARRFLDTETHPQLHVPFTATVYLPMIELLDLLRANGFQTWISSGGTVDFIRVFSQQAYGIPAWQVIGSEFKREVRTGANGQVTIMRLPEIAALNDKDGKPVGIDQQIGKRPAFAAGNVGAAGDIAMLEYSKGRTGPSFQLLIQHDDAEREFAYAEKDGASLAAAEKDGFTVVSIKDDWNTIFRQAVRTAR